MRPVRIGTRGSKLAVWQAEFVATALRRANPSLGIALEIIRTSGDTSAQEPPAGPESSGFFTKEIEAALLDSRIDLAVHSLKDLPTELPAGLALAAVLEREDPADVLISKSGLPLEALPAGAVVLTGAPRRQALVLHQRPDLVCRGVRGNVPTRLRKLKESDADALVLAWAGLKRLGLQGVVTQRLDPDFFVPACGQGALAVEVRSDDDECASLASGLEDRPTRLAVEAERAFLRALAVGCRAAAGAFARFDTPPTLILTGMAASTDGTIFFKNEMAGLVTSIDDACAIGARLAAELQAAGADAVLRSASGLPAAAGEAS